MAHIERINWTDSVPDAVAKIAEGNIGSMHYGPDETLRRNRPFELPKSNRTRYAVRQPWDIWTKRMGNIQRRLQKQNHARMLQCRATQLGMLSSEALLEVSNRQYRNEGKVKTIDAELYFKVKDFLEDFDPNNRADLHR
jgi:hypothetical protein